MKTDHYLIIIYNYSLSVMFYMMLWEMILKFKLMIKMKLKFKISIDLLIIKILNLMVYKYIYSKKLINGRST